jgi:hypothetical protein
MGTLWEREKVKNPFVPLHECMLSLLIGCMKVLFSKLLLAIFHLG